MRIVSGKYGGRLIKAPQSRAIRPTGDKVRGAVFNMLRSRGAVENAQAVDCFCGTGALGLEALSQGAAHCVFIDASRDSLNLAKDNAAALGATDAADFILKDAVKLPPRPDRFPAASLVFLDPPYGKNLVPQALVSLQRGEWLADDTLIVAETEKSFSAPFPPGFSIENERVYGDTKIFLLRVITNG